MEDRDKGGALWGDKELVMIPLVAITRSEPGHLPVGAIQDDVLVEAAFVHDPALSR